MKVVTNTLSSLSFFSIAFVSSTFVCETTIDCQNKFQTPGVSVCENGICTNPFEQGCLKAMGEKYGPKNSTLFKRAFEESRRCNSDDETINYTKSCKIPEWEKFFDYDEIRIANAEWGSAILFAWIFQIIMTEVLEVPATIENGWHSLPGTVSFYNRYIVNDEFPNYGDGTHVDTLSEAYNVKGYCRETKSPCAHLLPDYSDLDVGVDILLRGKDINQEQNLQRSIFESMLKTETLPA